MVLNLRTLLPYLEDNSDSDESTGLPDIIFEQSRFPTSLYGHRTAMSSTASNIDQLLKSFSRLEIYCDAPEKSFYGSRPSCSVDISLEEALHFPQRISSRVPTETNTYNQVTRGNLKAMWCRDVAHYFEWATGVPELRLMDTQERVKLVVRQLCRIICLMISYWTYRQGHDGIIFGSGVCFIPTEVQDETLKCYLTSLANIMQNNIISIFRKIAITREEYLLLKLIIFFDPPHIHFSPPNRLVLDSALKKYQAALVDHIKHSHPSLDHDKLTGRIAELFGTMQYIELAAQIDDNHWCMMTIQNDGNVRGRLTNEIHVNPIHE
ncbi:Ligand-binding domain of nuclear hormone receptor [Trichostrongylus colubriformis]|uniref:Ligand-binding domain of nuclear hormone receptor n=1 Tax=Trichostrongylus colubriformis TaxID=6319 RepID=A0AAN8G007_TRICO